jgi:acyl-CoA thioester hydrolase
VSETTSASGRSIVRLRVRFAETDLMGIVHHASYLTYLEVARIEWLRRRGVTYAQWANAGAHLAVAELTIKYRAPARFDDELDIETTLGQVRAASVRFSYRLLRPSDGALCVEASTLLAYIDHTHSLRRLSPEMIDALARSEQF